MRSRRPACGVRGSSVRLDPGGRPGEDNGPRHLVARPRQEVRGVFPKARMLGNGSARCNGIRPGQTPLTRIERGIGPARADTMRGRTRAGSTRTRRPGDRESTVGRPVLYSSSRRTWMALLRSRVVRSLAIVATLGLLAAVPRERSVTFPIHAMGTYVNVTLVTADSAAAAGDAAAAHRAVRLVDSLMSNWTTTSEVARINRVADSVTTTVQPLVGDVIARSLRVWR